MRPAPRSRPPRRRVLPRPRPRALLAALALAAAACGPEAPGGEPRGLVVLPGSTPSPPTPGLEVAPDRPFHHWFGEVPLGGVVEHVFTLENTDPSPVRVRRLDSSCGCSVPKIRAIHPDGTVVEGRPFDPGAILTVPPGARAEVSMRVDSTGVAEANKPKLVTIRVTSDSAHAPFLTLEGSLTVVSAFGALPKAFEFGRVPTGLGAEESVNVGREGERHFALSGVVRAPEPFEGTVRDDLRAPGEHWFVDLSLPPGLEVGPLTGEVLLESIDERTGERGPDFKLLASAQIVRDVTASPDRIQLRPRPEGGVLAREVTISTALPGHRFAIDRVEVLTNAPDADASALLDASPAPVHPDSRGRSAEWILRVSLVEEPPARLLAGDLVVHTDDPSVPPVRIAYALFPR